jgi:dihydrofolate reductase
MRKVILQEFVSLEGFAADAGGGVDFVPASMRGDQSFGKEQLALMEAIDTILLGRVTYGMFANHWPNVQEGEEDARFAEKINATPKVVFSRTLDRAPWGRWDDARIVEKRAEEEVARLKRQTGKDMVIWGSLSVARSLIQVGLIDEYRLVVCPLLLGSGKALFDGKLPAVDLTLQSARAMDRGAVSLQYVPEA